MATLPVRDLVTERIYKFAAQHLQTIVTETHARSISLRYPRLELPYGVLTDNKERAEQNLCSLVAELEALCRPHDFARFLLVFRKIPHQLAFVILKTIDESGYLIQRSFRPIFFEGIICGTNFILKFCIHAPTLVSNNERYWLQPTNDELSAALRLFTLCIIYRHELFRLNTIIRRDIAASSVSVDKLVEVYNERLTKRWQPQWLMTNGEGIVFPTLVDQVSMDKRILQYMDRDGTEHQLTMRNFIPISCDKGVEFARYPYLNTKDFMESYGVTFETFGRIWVGLNRLLIEALPLFWSDARVIYVPSNFLRAKLEQADDYCESGLGGSEPEGIWRYCHELLARDHPTECPTLEECQAVVQVLTYREFDGDVRFIEQPFIFYPISEGLLLWDYLRHGGLLRCLARQMTQHSPNDATRLEKGRALEIAIARAAALLPGVSGIRGVVLRESGRSIWEIDVGFVYKNILFLVEAKNRQKSVRYYFDASEVSSRVSQIEFVIKRMDTMLGQNLMWVRDKWGDCKPLRGAICVVCTEEAEFIASANPTYWLSLLACPRMCMLNELIEFLSEDDAIEHVVNSSAFLAFPAEPAGA
jgi:hypothetical protein